MRLFHVTGQRHHLRTAYDFIDIEEQTHGFRGPFQLFPNGPGTARFGGVLIGFGSHGCSHLSNGYANHDHISKHSIFYAQMAFP
jgi:hypothetical protein